MAGQKNPEDRNFGAGNETRERDSKVVRLLPRRNYRLIWLTLSTKSVERHDPAGEGSVAPGIGAEYEAALHGGLDFTGHSPATARREIARLELGRRPPELHCPVSWITALYWSEPGMRV